VLPSSSNQNSHVVRRKGRAPPYRPTQVFSHLTWRANFDRENLGTLQRCAELRDRASVGQLSHMSRLSPTMDGEEGDNPFRGKFSKSFSRFGHREGSRMESRSGAPSVPLSRSVSRFGRPQTGLFSGMQSRVYTPSTPGPGYYFPSQSPSPSLQRPSTTPLRRSQSPAGFARLSPSYSPQFVVDHFPSRNQSPIAAEVNIEEHQAHAGSQTTPLPAGSPIPIYNAAGTDDAKAIGFRPDFMSIQSMIAQQFPVVIDTQEEEDKVFATRAGDAQKKQRSLVMQTFEDLAMLYGSHHCPIFIPEKQNNKKKGKRNKKEQQELKFRQI